MPDGNYSAVETARILLARDLIRARRALGWSQAELARRAGVRVQTLDRLERGTHSPSVVVDKLDRALKAGEGRPAGGERSTRKKTG